MTTANATLLPPVYEPTPPPGATRDHSPGPVRHLGEVGVGAVLGAMIEQKRRASQPSYSAVDLASLDGEDDGPATERAPTRSEVFVKAR